MKSEDKFKMMQKMVESVFIARDLLYAEKWQEFGNLLHENWLFKKQMASKISNQEIDDAYARGIEAGAWAVNCSALEAAGFYCLFVHLRMK